MGVRDISLLSIKAFACCTQHMPPHICYCWQYAVSMGGYSVPAAGSAAGGTAVAALLELRLRRPPIMRNIDTSAGRAVLAAAVGVTPGLSSAAVLLLRLADEPAWVRESHWQCDELPKIDPLSTIMGRHECRGRVGQGF